MQTEFETLRKAIDAAVWYNFIHQYDADFKPMAVAHGGDDNFVTIEDWELKEMEIPTFDLLKDYSKLSYPHMQSIKSDADPLEHWDRVFGVIGLLKTERLLFILQLKVPLEQIVKYELAARGLNKKGKWIGFDQAERLWFGTNQD